MENYSQDARVIKMEPPEIRLEDGPFQDSRVIKMEPPEIRSEDEPFQEPISVRTKEEVHPSTSGINYLCDKSWSSPPCLARQHCRGKCGTETPNNWDQVKAVRGSDHLSHGGVFTCPDCCWHVCAQRDALKSLLSEAMCAAEERFFCGHCKRAPALSNTRPKDFKSCSCSACKYSAVILKKCKRFKQTRMGFFSCSCCMYRSADAGALKQHMKAKHPGQLNSCPYCDYESVGNLSLRRHLSAKHAGGESHSRQSADVNARKWRSARSGNRLFSCPHCEYKSAQSNSLKDHLMAKHGDQLLTCSHCEYKSNLASALKAHMRDKHANSRKQSNRKPVHVLKKHMKTKRASNMIHSCKHCGYSSLKRSNFRRHVKANHGHAGEASNNVHIVNINQLSLTP